MLTPRLSSYWVALVTPVSYGLIKPLVDGLGAEMVVDREPPPGLNDDPLGFEDAVRAALRMKLLNRQASAGSPTRCIADPEQHTVMDEGGAVRSIQAANVDMPERRARRAVERRSTSSGWRGPTGSTSRA